MKCLSSLIAVLLLSTSTIVNAAGAIEGEVQRQPLNMSAIVIFLAFVAATLGISYWAARNTRNSSEFYKAGGDRKTSCRERVSVLV